jgi:hypothetical protein
MLQKIGLGFIQLQSHFVKLLAQSFDHSNYIIPGKIWHKTKGHWHTVRLSHSPNIEMACVHTYTLTSAIQAP